MINFLKLFFLKRKIAYLQTASGYYEEKIADGRAGLKYVQEELCHALADLYASQK